MFIIYRECFIYFYHNQINMKIDYIEVTSSIFSAGVNKSRRLYTAKWCVYLVSRSQTTDGKL